MQRVQQNNGNDIAAREGDEYEVQSIIGRRTTVSEFVTWRNNIKTQSNRILLI